MKTNIVVIVALITLFAVIPTLTAAPSPLQQGADYVEAKMWPDAIEVLNRAIKADPKNPRAHYLLAYAYSQSGDNWNQQQALTRYASALALLINSKGSISEIFKYITPNYVLNSRGTIYEQTEKKAALKKKIGGEIYSFGNTQFKDKNMNEALTMFSIAADLDPSLTAKACNQFYQGGKNDKDRLFVGYYRYAQPFCGNDKAKLTDMGEEILKFGKGKKYAERSELRNMALAFLPESRVEQVLPFMEMVPISAGCFQMGDSFGDGEKDEKPLHNVCLSAFSMGKYEVTNAQYRMFKPNHDSDKFKGYTLNEDSQPVVNVSWEDAAAFADWLSQRSGKKFRLPTEAEWEYIARGGTNDRNYWGNEKDNTCSYANVHDLTKRGVFPDATNEHHKCDDGYAVSAPVGSFKGNKHGVYDLMGNVWEWCSDWYDEGYYSTSSEENPQGPSTGQYRALRGGAWFEDPAAARSSDRYGTIQTVRHFGFGFRLVSVP